LALHRATGTQLTLVIRTVVTCRLVAPLVCPERPAAGALTALVGAVPPAGVLPDAGDVPLAADVPPAEDVPPAAADPPVSAAAAVPAWPARAQASSARAAAVRALDRL